MEIENFSLDLEINNLNKNSNETIEELQRLQDFIMYYISAQNQLTSTLKQKILIPEDHQSRLHESILLTNLTGVYDSFQTLLINIDELSIKLKTDILEPLEEFKQNQIKINRQYIDIINKINNKQKNYIKKLEAAKINYYKEEYYTKEDSELNDLKDYKYKEEKYSESQEILLKNKMRVKIYENIYNY